jgi:hypothetical protein
LEEECMITMEEALFGNIHRRWDSYAGANLYSCAWS